MFLTQCMENGDSSHDIVMTFKNGAQLHQFNNRAGVPYSGIYEIYQGQWCERWSCERSKEKDMVKQYKEMFLDSLGNEGSKDDYE